MLTDFLSKINWIDVLMPVIVLRVLFIGLKAGFITEAFKLLGTIFSVFIILHYYYRVGGAFPEKLHLSKTWILVISFVALWGLVTFIFKLIRAGLLIIFSVETQKLVDRWGGGVLASARALIVCGLAFYLIILMGLGSEQRMVKASISRRCFGQVATGVYAMVYYGLVRKFFPDEKINNEALSLPRVLFDKKI